jgi:hypothetical protein
MAAGEGNHPSQWNARINSTDTDNMHNGTKSTDHPKRDYGTDHIYGLL